MSTQDFIFRGTSRFEIRRELGAGGMGVVYEAFDREQERVVALKTLKKLHPQSLYLFKNEFRALATLRHPNLIRLYELINEQDVWFFTMELLSGTDFFSYISHGDRDPTLMPSDIDTQNQEKQTLEVPGKAPAPMLGEDDELEETSLRQRDIDPDAPKPHKVFDELRLRNAMRQLAQGVEALHIAGKVHRDIKPSNVFVTDHERTILMDMGLVTRAGEKDREHSIVGTPQYMSPEQAMGDVVGPASDWYSVGVMLYEALTNVLPFDGPYTKVLFEKSSKDPIRPGALVKDLPKDLEELCVALLARNPSQRPSGKEVLRRLGVTRPKHMTMVAFAADAQKGTTFVGREEEQQALLQAFLESQSGKAKLFLVEGESGIGKSALVQHFLDTLTQEQDALVFRGRCYEQELLPYKAFDGVIDALARYLASIKGPEIELLLPNQRSLLGKLFPVLRRVKAIDSAEEGPEQDQLSLRHNAFLGLRELFTRLARKTPLVLFIDDLQWADADSMTLLEELLRPPNAPALLLLATCRSGVSLTLPSSLPLQQMTLGVLQEKEASELLHKIAGASVMNEEGLIREAAGHPLFLQELARYSAKAPKEATRVTRLDDVIFARALRMEEKARLLLELLSVFGAPLSNQALRSASGLEMGAYRERIDLLRSAHLLQTRGQHDNDLVELYHNRIGEAVRARIPQETLKQYHLTLARLLEQAEEKDVRALVRHLEAAGEYKRAIVYAEQSALLARKALAFEQAAEFYKAALRFSSLDDPRRATWQVALANVYTNAGRGLEAAEAFLEAAQNTAGRDRLVYYNRAAEHLLGSGYLARGREILDMVLAEIHEKMPKTPRRSLLSLLWHRFKIRLRGLRWKEKPEADVDPDRLLRLDVYKSVSVGLGQINSLQGADFQARNLYLALKTGERKRLSRAIALEAVFWSIPGAHYFKRAQELIDTATRLLEQESDPYLQGIVAGSKGIALYLLGQFGAAEESLLRSESFLQDRSLGATWELNNARVYRLFGTLRLMGRFGDERARFQEYLDDATRRGDRFMETILSCAFNVMWLAKDQPEEARRVAKERLTALPELGDRTSKRFELQPQLWDLWAWSHQLLYQGEAASQLDTLWATYQYADRSLLLRSQIARAYHYWIQGCLALAQSEAGVEPKKARAKARAAVKILGKEKVPYAQVWYKLVSAGLSWQEKRPEEALQSLQEVIQLAAAAQTPIYGALAQLRAGQLLGGEAGQSLIQDAERFFLQQGIKNPKRFALMYTPGLETK